MNQVFGTAGLLNGAMGGIVPQQYGGLLGGIYQAPQTNYEQMAAPYAQWAGQQLRQVTPASMPMPQFQAPVFQDPQQPRSLNAQDLNNYYFNSSYNNS